MSYQKITKTTPQAVPAGADLEATKSDTVSHLPAGKVPKLKSGDDAKRAKELTKYITDAEDGLRRILKAGFFLECLAADLPHGQLGPWVEAHCKGRSWRTVQRWKEIASGLGEAVGINLKDRLASKLHKVLAMPLNKVPENLKAIREKIDAEIAGKSYRQLFLEIKQVEEADPTKPKKGRLPGCKGTSAEQRALAAEAAEQAALEELTISAGEQADWALEKADDKNLGTLDEATLTRLYDAWTNGARYISNVLAARKGGAK